MTDTTTETTGYDATSVEERWQQRWHEDRLWELDVATLGRDAKFYNLVEFPYPSAEGLHVGHVFTYAGADTTGRYLRMQGKSVFQPIGFDSFGIHTENYALKVDKHPKALTAQTIARYREQLERLGIAWNWDQEVSTNDPDYYRWTQWIFVQLFKAGLAVQKEAPVVWCPTCLTVLAFEQLEGDQCERCGTQVEDRVMLQWYLKITEFADRLVDGLNDLDWPDVSKHLQRDWIGRSYGADITFGIDGRDDTIGVFTTRPDTLFGATFMALAVEHPLVAELAADEATAAAIDEFVHEVRRQRAATAEGPVQTDRRGVFTGSYAIHPLTGARLPVYAADYVLVEYGSGAIMGVPAHDQRDWDFAMHFGLDIVEVVDGGDPSTEAYPGEGPLVNSGDFTGIASQEGRAAITARLAEEGKGEAVTRFRMHDWLISRQRYWGPPIPIIYCEACGPVPVPEEDLPVLLPPLADFRPDDSGVSPLARDAAWYHVPCPGCGRPARRETDVSDTFLDSAWYYLRYPSTEFDDRPFDPARTRRWLPVASYIGGNEHAVLHLLYSRFLAMVLQELGHLHFEEPFARFRAHGLIVKDGAKMSKSRGNVVIPDEYIAQWGADTFRMYLMFLGPFEEGGDFRDAGISGPRRFLDRVWDYVGQAAGGPAGPGASAAPAEPIVAREALVKYHQTVKKVTGDLESLNYNTAIAAMMELLNTLREHEAVSLGVAEGLVVMLAPFAPHFAEECWERLGHTTSVMDAAWPGWDEQFLVQDRVEVVVQVNGKTRSRVTVPAGADEEAVGRAALADEATRRFLDGKTVRKRIYVPGRLINLVVG